MFRGRNRWCLDLVVDVLIRRVAIATVAFWHLEERSRSFWSMASCAFSAEWSAMVATWSQLPRLSENCNPNANAASIGSTSGGLDISWWGRYPFLSFCPSNRDRFRACGGGGSELDKPFELLERRQQQRRNQNQEKNLQLPLSLVEMPLFFAYPQRQVKKQMKPLVKQWDKLGSWSKHSKALTIMSCNPSTAYRF